MILAPFWINPVHRTTCNMILTPFFLCVHFAIHQFLQIILVAKYVVRHGIESIPSHKHQRRPLPSLLSSMHVPYQWSTMHLSKNEKYREAQCEHVPGEGEPHPDQDHQHHHGQDHRQEPLPSVSNIMRCGVVSVPASRPPVPGSNLGPGPPHSVVWGAGFNPINSVQIM